MSVPADNVRNDEDALRLERAFYARKQVLELEDVMQSLIGHYGVIFPRRDPFVHIGLNEMKPVSHSLLGGRNRTTSKHLGVQVQAINHEFRVSLCLKAQRQLNLEIAVAGTDADEPFHAVFPALALLFEARLEHLAAAANSQRFQLRTHIGIRPVMEDVRQFMY